MAVRVIDASVFAAMAFREDREQEARRIIGDSEIFAPTILLYELGNVACVKAKRSPLEGERILTALRYIVSLEMTLMHVSPVEIAILGMETGLSAYDAAYLHLARSLDCPLATFDQRLARAAE